ncbi:MAG: DUF3466 family protein [Phycisphaerae bacterium]|nr:DUF3466 family protein [Phycisphaerae bacterium]
MMVNASGTAVGCVTMYVDGDSMGERSVRWDAHGTLTILDGLGAYADGWTSVYAYAINDTGTVVGSARKFVDAQSMGPRAVRWDPNGIVTELGDLGTAVGGYTSASANAINAFGTAVGDARKYVGGDYRGIRAVRWDATGTSATELGGLGGFYDGAGDINASGTAVGGCGKYVNGIDQGFRAARWEAGGTAGTELGDLGTDPSGVAYANANAINGTGTAVGDCWKYADGISVGTRAVRWEAGGTAGTELDNLGTDPSGVTTALAWAINDPGTAVGYARKYVSGVFQGTRAVRWEADGTPATELAKLGTDPNGFTEAGANAINAFGTAVGQASKYISGSLLGDRAVLWELDGDAVDLSELIDPNSGWTLTDASYISDTGWIVGEGMFDPDGAGGYDAYERLYLLQIPDPATISLLALGGLAVLWRRRK